MADPTVLVEIREEVALVTLNRADASNTIDMALARELLAAAIQCETHATVRAVVLTGAGKNFCFGGDLRGMVAGGQAVDAYLRELTSYLHSAISHFVRMDAPVVAAVNGTAAGAGVGLVAMADLAVSAAGAKFSLAYTGVGLTPDGSTSFLLPRLIGARRAMELILLNRVLTSEEALGWGLVNRVVADGEAVDEAMAIARKLAAGPKGAFGKAKRLVARSLGPLEHHLALESQTIAAQAASSEGHEGIRAFLEKRNARYARNS